MEFRFANPQFFLLLLVLPLIWWWTLRLRGIPPVRRWVIRVARTLFLLLIIFALAEFEIIHKSRLLSVFFVVDQSDSIPPDKREAMKDYIRLATDRMGVNDRAGLIVFGAEPSIDSMPRADLALEEVKSVIDTQNSNLASALRLAVAAFPQDTQKRIVLLSDGNENVGSAIEVASVARNAGIAIDVLPVEYGSQPDVILEKVQLPQKVFGDSPFDVKTFIYSPEYKKAKLRLYQDGSLFAEDDVELLPDRKNIFTVQRRIPASGFYSIQATVEVEGDPRPQNNSAYAFTDVRGEPNVLYVEGDFSVQNVLNRALRANGITVTMQGVDGIPATLEELQNYDALILSNVHASSMTRLQMEIIKTAVNDLGIGLIMIGGENSFGAGGYNDTPIEEALPVEMEIKARQVMPNGALAVILHTCEFADGNTWAREITLAALDVLSSRDYFGVLEFSWSQARQGAAAQNSGMQWVVEMGLVGNKTEQRRAIQTAQPEDMPDFTPGMQMAFNDLSALKAQTKHMLIISDGDPQRPPPQLVTSIKNAGITVSSICIYPHSPNDTKVMEAISMATGGRFYHVQDPNELPQIFIKEASTVRRSLIVEEPISVKFNQYSDVLAGIGPNEFPGLQGYVLTEKKDLTTIPLLNDKDDVLLAHWQYGLGRTAAYTSDVRPKWAAPWVGWDKFDEFWGQLTRYVLRQTSSRNFQVSTTTEGNVGRVVVDAINEDGSFMNFLSFDGQAIDPELEGQSFPLRQVSPGRYVGEFPVSSQGSYLLTLVTKDQEGNREMIRSGVAVSYSPEYTNTKSNDSLLEQMTAIAGGKILNAGNAADLTHVFTHDLPSGATPEPLFPWLLLAASILFLFDIFVRRVYLDWADVKVWAGKTAVALIPRRRAGREERMETLLKAKKRATSPNEEEAEEETTKPRQPQTAASRSEKKRSLEVSDLFQDIKAEAETKSTGDAGPAPVAGAGEKPPMLSKPAAPPRDQDKSRRDVPPGEGGTTSRLLEMKRRKKKDG